MWDKQPVKTDIFVQINPIPAQYNPSFCSKIAMKRILALAAGLAALPFCNSTAAEPAPAAAPAATVSVSAKLQTPPVDEAMSALLKERDRLMAENQIREETLKKELATKTTEVRRLQAEADLAAARFNGQLDERQRSVQEKKLEMEEASVKVALETEKQKQTMEKELIALRAAREKAEAEAALAVANYTRQANELKLKEIEWTHQLAEMNAKMDQKDKELALNNYVEEKPVYLDEPLCADGTLVISDRRVPLNGPITGSTADYISSRINYFNNKDHTHPIFIVIDNCPGGSVMAGYDILKSMESSQAPVYVVVKSFAASMAACIATMAKKSFAYPNAIILHHQISIGTQGNLTQHREAVKNLEDWWSRLAVPLSKKMGVTPDAFIKAMYEHNSGGDWNEFADNAVKLKWVDVIVDKIHETSLVKNPDTVTASTTVKPFIPSRSEDDLKEKHDDKGNAFMVLPRLGPFDCYFLYNPDNYYRVQ
jgi:ATP-dependent Clp protease, protease subunit